MIKLLKTYQNRLANISGKNRNLCLSKLGAYDLDFHELDYNTTENSSFQLIEKILNGEKKIIIGKITHPKDEKNNILSRKLQQIVRRANYIQEERGSYDLQLAWPFVEGNFIDGPNIRCALLYWPISLIKDGNNWVLTIENQAVWNKNFLIAYSHFYKVKIDEDLLNEALDEAPTDSVAFRTHLYYLIKNQDLNIDFARESFENRLNYFLTYQKNDFETLFKKGTLKLSSNAVIGIFPLLDSFLNPDYENIIQNFESSDFKHFFLKNQSEISANENFINQVKEEQIITPFKIDIFQENILKAVKKGNSLVVQGPPGTGKSQLISNIVADFIAQGKKVLVVCEKKVALEVISNRLQHIKIGEFASLVNDHIRDRNSVFQSINDRIQSISEYKSNVNSMESIMLERNFSQVSKEIEKATNSLDQFKNDYYSVHSSGFLIAELLSYPFKYQDIKYHSSFSSFLNMNYEQVLDFQNEYQKWQSEFQKTKKLNSIWDERVSFENISNSNILIQEIPNLKFSIQEIQSHFKTADLNIKLIQNNELIKAKVQIKQIESLILNNLELSKLIISNAQIKFTEIEKINNTFERLEKVISKITNLGFNAYQRLYFNEGIDLEFIKNFLNKEKINLKSKLKLSFNQLINKEYKKTNQFILKNNLSLAIDSNSFSDFIDLQLELQNKYKLLNISTLIISDIQKTKSEYLDLINAFNELNQLNIYNPEIDETNLENYLSIKIPQIIHGIELVNNFYNNNQLFTIKQLNKWLFDTQSMIDDFEILEVNFESFQKIDFYQSKFQNEHKLDLAIYLYNQNIENDIILESAIYTWLEEVKIKFPSLKTIHELEEKQKILSENLPQKINLSKEIIIHRLQENTFKELEYNRLRNQTTYRELQYQVNKKKKIWPIRKLIKEHSEEIFKLIPCWLATPETVSALFEPKELFDLVIFDEASQCFAERGLPSVIRGKQILVIGDKEQLSPSDLYQVRFEEEDEDENSATEVESILDLCSLYLEQSMLKWHYRSENYSLIHFSNQNFYQNKLYFSKLNSESSKALEMKIVSGIWSQNCNLIEAKEIINYLINNKLNFENKTIGIITLNYKQQELILDLLLENQLEIPNLVFVKNIENVQGNEADIILLSCTYAPDSKGKFSLNMGLLNKENGEKRLNVAITRAKNKMIIFSSIPFKEIETNHLQHNGVKLLFQYLSYVNQISHEQLQLQIPEKQIPNSWQEGISMKYHFGYKWIN